MRHPRVGVAVLTLGTRPTELRALLESVERQETHPERIVVVGNGTPLPDDIGIDKSEDWAKLPKGWPKKQAVTRELGDQWLDRNSAALLHVPSALVPKTSNFILNPLHPDATKIQVVSVSRQGLDRRLLQ